jgi:prepilin-type N-terminal cleavage/methylation domain-containing protein
MRRIHAVATKGFTLIELIGVLAIIAIMSAVLAPNVLRQIDRAAIDAERSNLKLLNSQVHQFVQRYGFIPGQNPNPPRPSWDVDLATYAEMGSADVVANRRQLSRGFVVDLAGSRVLLVSTLRAGIVVPTGTGYTATQFNQMWDTQWTPVQFTTNWPGWAGLTVDQAEYLVIERVNLKSDLQTVTILAVHAGNAVNASSTTTTTTTGGNNGNGNGAGGNGNGNNGNGNGNGGSTGGAGTTSSGGITQPVSIVVTDLAGKPTSYTLAVNQSLPLDCRAGYRIDFRDENGAVDYTYLVSNVSKTIQFMSSGHWTAQ